ncbi:peroxiredoxin-like family protein [Denitrobaculum tricleocarpae]|uniref:AhpC/TSA family protein n=1 Tax=Denitrobaculum tricleocarpae TaxID=2591009 RepID=A0A545U2F4_9PROT|nr:peroxiredoxin-like family protein [Denitrobaculum tricleocarpae]TQV83660.1 AhpC/TSA family protein [Denitrobaculum tricleocarpae]
MSAITPLVPRQAVPSLELPTVGGGTWSLADQKPENFTIVVVYRGLHCPICSMYLGDLNQKLEKFTEKGVSVFVATSDGEARASEAKEKWGLDKLTLGYGLSLEKAREWGLYVSAGIGTTSIGIEEPDLFVEPGIFLIRPDGTLYFGSVQTMPFARPAFGDILKALDFVIAKGYPARGEVVDLPAQAAE